MAGFQAAEHAAVIARGTLVGTGMALPSGADPAWEMADIVCGGVMEPVERPEDDGFRERTYVQLGLVSADEYEN